jgi:hypothetical protein
MGAFEPAEGELWAPVDDQQGNIRYRGDRWLRGAARNSEHRPEKAGT